MPGLVAFGRRWSVGSDDLFLPSVCLSSIHAIGLIASLLTFVLSAEELKRSVTSACSTYLWEMYCSVVFLLAASFLLEMSLTMVSLRGSILYDAPRKSAQYIIYALLLTLASKLIWSVLAAIWIKNYYFDCKLMLAKQVLLGLVICTWVILFGVVITAWCTYDVAGRSWVKMKRYQASMKEIESKHSSYKRSGTRNRNWRQRKVIRAYQDSWNHRCRLLFCCMHRTERNRDSFTDLAKLLSEFFRDLDLVPSDVVVGLLLLRRLQRLEQCSIVKQKRNNTYEFLSGIAITPRTKFVAMNDPVDLEIFRNVVHYMHYASAAYGWPWYIIPHGVKGMRNLCSNLSCCYCCNGCCCPNRPDLSSVVLEDNCCYCNYAVIPTMFKSDNFEIIYATYHVDVGETPFFVVVDYEKKSVVVSIRGTLSLKDVITDLNAEGEALPVNPPREDWLGHKGIVQAAVYMKAQLDGESILEKAFSVSQEKSQDEYNLVIVGHSLGAGTAAILAVLLKDEYPTLQCYAYSPPGGLLSMPVVEYTKSFVTSVIVGKDVVPRIGLSQMEALRADLLNAMKKSRKPKWHTLVSGMACCCCVKSEFALPQRLSSAPSIQSEEFMRSRRSLRDLREVTINPNESAISLTVHQPLYPPGRIMHIVRHHPKKDEIKYETMWRRMMAKGEPVFQALWTENTDYGQVLISPGMIQDHMPDQVMRALNRILETKNTCMLGELFPWDFDYEGFRFAVDVSCIGDDEENTVVKGRKWKKRRIWGKYKLAWLLQYERINGKTNGWLCMGNLVALDDKAVPLFYKNYFQDWDFVCRIQNPPYRRKLNAVAIESVEGISFNRRNGLRVDANESVVNNHGPAKPQRTLAASTSPLMLSRDSLEEDSGTRSSFPSRLFIETSFGNISQESEGSPLEGTLLNPSPLIVDADADTGELNPEELTPTNEPGAFTDLISSLNLNWDYVTQLQEKYLEDEDSEPGLYSSKIRPPPIPTFSPYYHPSCPSSHHYRHHPYFGQHERKGSFGNNSSSGCSESGSTFKEVFGPIKYDEWMAPLASPETLSEISSLSSRASFFLPRDQSPLMRIKGKNGTSASLHRYNKNGRGLACTFGSNMGNSNNGSGNGQVIDFTGGHHNRSLSCTYPEMSDVSIISFSAGLFGNSKKACFFPSRSQAKAATTTTIFSNSVSSSRSGPSPPPVSREMESSLSRGFYVNGNEFGNGQYESGGEGRNDSRESDVTMEEDNQEESNSGADHEHDFSSSGGATSQRLNDPDCESLEGSESNHPFPIPSNFDAMEMVGETRVSNGGGGDTKRVSFNLKKKYASKDSGCSVGDVCFTSPSSGKYEPVYPVFSSQQEYGVPQFNDPHYNYPCQSPPESPKLDGPSQSTNFPSHPPNSQGEENEVKLQLHSISQTQPQPSAEIQSDDDNSSSSLHTSIQFPKNNHNFQDQLSDS